MYIAVCCLVSAVCTKLASKGHRYHISVPRHSRNWLT